jgi:hypothetical protein
VASAISLAAIGFANQGQAASANPTPVCSNGLCTVTFDYSGDYYVYSPPSGIRTMSFEVAGAQGGRTGGLGGKVTGTFSNIPASLYVYVGGAGKQGTAAAGGFNGGGVAGGSHGDEGSGGGASDIRLTTSIDDRIVVAGGGGGTGGWVGLAGGAGGGLIASSGSGTNPNGGSAGNQLTGGSGGSGYSGGAGTAGGKGVGGTGGTGSIGGGGGGGGGYFGGGGGGGDGIPSGTDGAGGGGGSSYASSGYTKSVAHTQGLRSGNGQVILTYAYSPTLTTFAPTSTSSNQQSVQFNLAFSQNIGGLDASDFGFSGTAGGCAVTGLAGSGASYMATVSGCGDGTLALTLAADSVTGATTGPAALATSSTVTLDRKNPGFTVTAPTTPSSQTSLPFSVAADEPVTGLSSSSFGVTGAGCSVGSVTGSSTNYSVAVTGCASNTNVQLTLKSGAANDLNGNTGPLTPVTSTTVLTDFDAPSVLSFVKDSNSRAGLIGFDLFISEPVTGITASSFALHGSGCTLSKLSGSRDSYQLWLSDCSQGATAWVTLNALASTDSANNQGPLSATDSQSVSVDDQAPTAAIAVLDRSSQTAQPTFEVRFSEPVSGFTQDSFSNDGSANNCKFSLTTVLTGLTYRVAASNCTAGSLRLLLVPMSVQDATGNLGPLSQLASPIVTIDKSSAANTGAARWKHGEQIVAPENAKPTPVQTVTPIAIVAKPKHQDPQQQLVIPAHKEVLPSAKPEDKTMGFAAVAVGGSLLLIFLLRRASRRRLM